MSVRKKGSSAGRGGDGATPRHPIHEGIEKLYAAGKTPRIRLDARRNDVVVPAHVREKWQESLVIDLDASYPLALVYDDTALHCDLAFAGQVTRCTFPWASIYGLFDRASGQGVQIAAHMPKAVLPEALSLPPSALPRLRPVSRLHAAEPPRAAPPSKPAAEPSKPAEDSDELAKARRAKFRVITGG